MTVPRPDVNVGSVVRNAVFQCRKGITLDVEIATRCGQSGGVAIDLTAEAAYVHSLRTAGRDEATWPNFPFTNTN